jgi:hypothetical protein
LREAVPKKKRPGCTPTMDKKSATKLRSADVQRRPAATLSERREFVEKAGSALG